MGTIMIVVYIIASIIGFGMAIIMFIAIVRIWQILNEIIASGAIPKVLEARAKKEANYIIRYGAVQDPTRADKICKVLSSLKNDRDAIQLLQQIDELKKQQT